MSNSDINPTTFLYQANFEESSRVYHRTDWFLVFHAILIEAFFGAAPQSQSESIGPQLAVGAFGLLTAYVWLMSGIRQRWVLWHLGMCMSDSRLMPSLSEFHEELYATRKKYLPKEIAWAGTVGAFTVVIPAAITIVWLVILGSELDITPYTVGTLTLLLITTLLTSRLGNKPKIPDAAIAELVPSAGVEKTSVDGSRQSVDSASSPPQ